MASEFPKVTAGQPLQIPAAFYNNLVDLEQAHRGQDLGLDKLAAALSSGIVRVRNQSGTDRAAFEILGIDSPTIDFPAAPLPAGYNLHKLTLALDCVRPATTYATDHGNGRFVVLLEPLKSDAIGRAIAAGVALCQVDLTDTNHTAARPIHNDPTHLESAESGPALILAIDRAATGTKWALVRIGSGAGTTGEDWYQLTANLDAEGTATANPLTFDASGAGAYTVDAGTTVTLKDLIGDHWGVKGERIRGRRRQPAGGEVFEALSSGAPWHVFSLSADMGSGETKNASVTTRAGAVTVSLTDAVLPAGHTFTAGTNVFASYDLQAKKWKVTGKALIGVLPLVGYQFTSPHFQTKTRELAVLSAKAENAWTTAHDGTACP